MIRDTIDHLQQRIERAGGLSEERRAEMLGLVAELREEAQALPEDKQRELQESIRTPEEGRSEEDEAAALRQELDEIKVTADDLRGAILEFEASHPRLTDAANRLAMMLSSVGI